MPCYHRTSLMMCRAASGQGFLAGEQRYGLRRILSIHSALVTSMLGAFRRRLSEIKRQTVICQGEVMVRRRGKTGLNTFQWLYKVNDKTHKQALYVLTLF